MSVDGTATPPKPAPERPPRLLFAFAIVGLAWLTWHVSGMLYGLVARPLARGDRMPSFFFIQLLLLAMLPLAYWVFWFLKPAAVARIPAWAKLLALLLAPLPVCWFPVPALFLVTVDRMANAREMDIDAAATAKLRDALEACRRSAGRYPDNPEACVNERGVKEIALPPSHTSELRYFSDGRRYALGVHGSNPSRDRSAVVVYWSDTGRWSWHDYESFASAVGQSRELLGYACQAGELWSCRPAAY